MTCNKQTPGLLPFISHKCVANSPYLCPFDAMALQFSSWKAPKWIHDKFHTPPFNNVKSASILMCVRWTVLVQRRLQTKTVPNANTRHPLYRVFTPYQYFMSFLMLAHACVCVCVCVPIIRSLNGIQAFSFGHNRC